MTEVWKAGWAAVLYQMIRILDRCAGDENELMNPDGAASSKLRFKKNLSHLVVTSSNILRSGHGRRQLRF